MKMKPYRMPRLQSRAFKTKDKCIKSGSALESFHACKLSRFVLTVQFFFPTAYHIPVAKLRVSHVFFQIKASRFCLNFAHNVHLLIVCFWYSSMKTLQADTNLFKPCWQP